MFSCEPYRIDALSCGLKYISGEKEILAVVKRQMRIFSFEELSPLIPTRYRNPGFPLYMICDKEYAMKSEFEKDLAQNMDDTDVLAVVNTTSVQFIFPKSLLPKRILRAMEICSHCSKPTDLIPYYPELPYFEAYNKVLRIVNGNSDKEAIELLKIMGDKAI